MEPTELKEADVLFVLPDISGYTKFMIANEKSLAHAQAIISELIRTIIAESKAPLKVAEIEGDAVFLYAVKSSDSWETDKRAIGECLEKFSEAFYSKLKDLADTKTCDCGGCSNVQSLRIKTVAHSGKAILNKIDRFLKISGVDTIIAHRLLKNSVPSHDYILVSKAAFNDIAFGKPEAFIPHEEHYDDVGTVEAMLLLLGEDASEARKALKKPLDKSTWLKPSIWTSYVRIGLDLVLVKLGLKKPAVFELS
jgi:hypothetical protein